MKINRLYIVLAVLAVTGCSGHKAGLPLVQMEEVAQNGANGIAVYPGRAVADENSSVAFRVSGTIEKILVEPGQNVKKGTPVAVLDQRDYRTQLNATEAEYSQIKAEVDRVMAMYEDDAVTANDYDKARYGLTQIQQKLNHHRSQLADCTLRAPFDGCIGDVNFHKGETVMAGMPVMTLFSGNNTEVLIDISAVDYQRREEVDSATASFKIRPGVEFPLTIKSVSRSANANQLYQMKFTVDTDSLDVTPGMSAMVNLYFKGQEVREDMSILSNAIFVKEGKSLVYVFDEESERLHSREINVLSIDASGNASVTGLKPGEIIATAGVSKLFDGQKVRRVQPVSDTNPGGLL